MNEMGQLDLPTLAELQDVAVRVARECGRLITDERPETVSVADTKSSDVDVVTVMDRRSEALAQRVLAKLRPLDGLLGEEGLDSPSTTGVTWVIDPIDGTVNYLYNIPAFAVSVAAVVGDPRQSGNWRPVVGAVFNPLRDELFTAIIGHGASLHSPQRSERLTSRSPQPLGQCLVATGFGYAEQQRRWQGQAVAHLIPQIRDLRRSGSAAVDLCDVALGRLDAYYDHNLNSWDYAAGWLIAVEAGAAVRGLDTPFPDARLLLAGAESTCEAIAEAIAPYVPAEA